MPAFRRLIGKPILSDVRLQDVVFAEGRSGNQKNAGAVRIRASTTPVSVLGDAAVRDERKDMQVLCVCLPLALTLYRYQYRVRMLCHTPRRMPYS